MSLLHSPTKNDRNCPIDELLSEDEARKRREQLERRPSYRMILKDIASFGTAPQPSTLCLDVTEMAGDIKKENEEVSERPTGNLLGPPSNLNTVHFEVPTTTHLNNGAQRQVDTSSNRTATPAVPAMRNQNEPSDQLLSSRLLNPPRTVSDIPSQPQPQIHAPGIGQLPLSNGILPLVSNELLNLKPVSEISLNTSVANFSHNNDWQSGILSYGNAGNHSPLAGSNMANRQGSNSLTSLSDNDESSRKRQVRLLKNREAAKECRRKKKEYVKCLESRVAVLENQNKALIDELKALKEIYCAKPRS